MSPSTVFKSLLYLLCGIAFASASVERGLNTAAGQDDKSPQDALFTREMTNKPLNSLGRPKSQGPTFPATPVVSTEQHAQLRSRAESLILQLADPRLEIREKATSELIAIGHVATSILEKGTKHNNPEISSRSKRILSSFPKLTHVIVDAVDIPIPFAKVITTLASRPSWRANNEPSNVEPRVIGGWSDESGRIEIPGADPNAVTCFIQVQHPAYGRGCCEVSLRPEQTRLQFPLIHKDSEFRDRALTGVIVAPDGQPIVGAAILCNEVRTPGMGLIQPEYGPNSHGKALSDDEGRFRIYVPNHNRKRERGDAIPPNSHYHVSITTPDDESYFPIAADLSNAAPARVEMPRPTRRHRFPDPSGGLLEKQEQLSNLFVEYKPIQGKSVRLDTTSLIHGFTDDRFWTELTLRSFTEME